MRSRRVYLRPWVFSLFLFSGGAGLFGQDVSPVTSVMAVDADDKTIGEVLRTDFTLQQLQVAMEVDGELVIVLLGRDSFSHGARNAVYFESSNCSGRPFLSAMGEQPQPFGRPAAVAGPKSTLYFGVEGSEQVRLIGGVLRGSTCQPFGHEASVLEAESAIDLADQFSPPFRIVSARPSGPGAKGPVSTRRQN